MTPTTSNGDETVKHDEDVKFENNKESAIVPLTEAKDQKPVTGETSIPPKEDTLGNSDFPPLTELEKQPKLPEKE